VVSWFEFIDFRRVIVVRSLFGGHQFLAKAAPKITLRCATANRFPSSEAILQVSDARGWRTKAPYPTSGKSSHRLGSETDPATVRRDVEVWAASHAGGKRLVYPS